MSDEQEIFNKASWGSGNPEIVKVLQRLKKVLTQAEKQVLKDFKARVKDLAAQIDKETTKDE